MYKLAAFTDEISQDLDVVISVAKKYELEGLEIRSVNNKGPHNFTKDEIKVIKSKIGDSGLKVCSIASPFFKCDINSEKGYNEHLDILKNCINLAHILGTNIVRGFTFWRTGDTDRYFDRIVDKFTKPIEIVKKEGIILGIENESATFVGTGKYLARFLKAVNSDVIKAIWDPANEVHDLTYGESPFPTGYNWVKDKIVHVHLKDAIKVGESGKPESVPVGEGDVNYWGQLRALKEDGYDGYISLETHWRKKTKLTEDQVNRPGGSDYSAFAKESSEYCLENIHKIINSI
ncbi:MAG: sugar phosphate isomerase/epimerase family protein [Candidatus Firestonebacteria bacterium]